MTDSACCTARRIYNPLPEETTKLNLTWQSGAGVVALSGIALAAAAYTGRCRPLISREVTYAIGGAVSLLSLTFLYLLRSIDSFINKNGDRFLHDAVETSNTKIVSWLLFFGANANAQNSKDETALHFACDSSDRTEVQLDIMEELIKYGANVNAASHMKETPLHYMVSNSKAMIETILEQPGDIGQDVNVKKIKLLRQHGAMSDVERDPSLDNTHFPRATLGLSPTKPGATPLGLATERSHEAPKSDTHNTASSTASAASRASSLVSTSDSTPVPQLSKTNLTGDRQKKSWNAIVQALTD
jgi:hypothetical protein